MQVEMDKRAQEMRERLRERLVRAAELRCAEHGQPVVAVFIHGYENGWFDSRWTTCCENLEQQAAAIVRGRC
jgi:esterase/lipase superfamily enzyme